MAGVHAMRLNFLLAGGDLPCLSGEVEDGREMYKAWKKAMWSQDLWGKSAAEQRCLELGVRTLVHPHGECEICLLLTKQVRRVMLALPSRARFASLAYEEAALLYSVAPAEEARCFSLSAYVSRMLS